MTGPLYLTGMNIKYDYVAAATTYAGLLGSLGGVCITILTLVLVINPQQAKQKNFHPLLVSALMVATIACFAGAHLMADVVAFKDSANLLRLFRIGSINTYLSIGLFSFSLMLLPMVYDKNIPQELKKIGLMTFLVVSVAEFYWVYSAVTATFADLPSAISNNSVLLIALILNVFVIVGSYRLLQKDSDNFPPQPFYLCLAAVIVSLCYYNYTRDYITLPKWIHSTDKLLYCLASALPIASLLGLCIKSYKS